MERPAWHLILENQQSIAIAQQQVMEYLHQASSIPIPDCADRCQQILIWRDRIVPLLGALPHHTAHEHILVILYTREHHAEYVALALSSPPQAVTVRNLDQCDADAAQQTFWREALQCCVQVNSQKLALVDFSRLG